MLFELDEDGAINRIPFCRQDKYYFDDKTFNKNPFIRKEEYYDIDENETINETLSKRSLELRRTLSNPLFDDIGEEDYKKLIDYQINNEIENNKNKFLNFVNDWVEVEKEEDAKYYLIFYKECPNIFEVKKIYEPEAESIDKKIYYLKPAKKRRSQWKR